MNQKSSLRLNQGFKIKNKLNLTTSFSFEVISLILLLTIFLLFNLVTSGRDHSVWMDEVMFVDPAANLYLGNGFTSSAWWFQTKDEFWAGNAPLYSIILYHWMKIFGFSLAATRALNYVIMVVSGLMLWLSVLRLKLVTSALLRITLIALLLSGQGIAYSYRIGRYDSLSIALFAACMLAYSVSSSWLRCVLLLCIGIFVPISGLQLVMYAVILCSLILVFLGNSFLKESISLAMGSFVGMTFLYILYCTNGVWSKFVISTLGTQSIIGQIGKVIIQGDYKGLTRFVQIPEAAYIDYSFLLLLALAVVIAINQIKNKIFKWRSPLLFGIAAGICIPIVMYIAGKYPLYYSWMAFVPLAICVCSTISDSPRLRRNSWQRLVVPGVLVVACLIGFPWHLVVSIRDWNNSDYAPVEALVDRNVTKNDWVYCDFGPYFAVKKKAAVVLLNNYMKAKTVNGIPPKEKEKVSILIINPSDLEQAVSRLGGKWYETGDSLGLNQKEYYPYKIFRRDITS